MSSRAAILALALAAVAAPAAAQFRIELTDENVAAQGGNDLLLEQAIDIALFEDGPVQAGLLRAGLERGCMLIHAARRQALDSHREAFRRHLVAAMRAVVPAERMATSTNIVIGGLAAYRTRVTSEVRRTGGDVIAAAIAEARSAAAVSLGEAPPVPREVAAGRFADWRLDRPISRQTACMLIAVSQNRTPAEFAAMKSAFDGFYRRTGE